MGGLVAWIGHLGGRRLKPKTTKRYVAGLRSLRLDCTLDMAGIEVYSQLILQKIIECLRRLYGEGDTHERRPTIYDILHKLTSRFDQRTFEGANLHLAFCLAFARFLQMTLQEDRLLLVFPSSKTDPFRRQMTLTISAARDEACVVKSLRNFFERFPKSHYHPLFSTSAGTFNRTYVTRKLQEGIRILGYGGNCTGHLFRRGAATSARLAGLLEEKIQLLADTREHNLSHHEYPLQAPPAPLPGFYTYPGGHPESHNQVDVSR